MERDGCRHLGFSAVAQPQLTSATFNVAGKLVLTGTGFRGVSSASGGNGSQDSPSNFPVVQLRRLANEQSTFVLSDPTVNVSATAFTSAVVPNYSGYSLVTVFANGIPSASVVVFGPVPPASDIAVEQPAGMGLALGGTRSFGTVVQGRNASLTPSRSEIPAQPTSPDSPLPRMAPTPPTSR